MTIYEFLFGFTDESRAKFPWVFEKGEIDRHECQRVVPMQVLSLGMGRSKSGELKSTY